jgi:hypothetical protein
MLAGACYGAEVTHKAGGDVASWKRLVITVFRRATSSAGVVAPSSR